MDFEKSSFSVDWFTPGDKYVPKRLSFPKSACISMDDIVNVSDPPRLSLCFTSVDELSLSALSGRDASTERACGWTNSAPLSPLSPTPASPTGMYSQEILLPLPPSPSPYTASIPCAPYAPAWRALASPGLVDIADDCASCGVDLDVSCLDALDEQLLASPMDCFMALCWTAAVQDDVGARFLRKKKRTRGTGGRARSCKPERERERSRGKGKERGASPPPPSPARAYPGSFERSRPLAAKISLPLDKSPQRSPTTPRSASFYDTSYPEKEPCSYIFYADDDRQGRQPRPAKKRDWTLMPAPLRLPPTPVLKTSPPSPTFRVVSDVVPQWLKRKSSPLVVT